MNTVHEMTLANNPAYAADHDYLRYLVQQLAPAWQTIMRQAKHMEQRYGMLPPEVAQALDRYCDRLLQDMYPASAPWVELPADDVGVLLAVVDGDDAKFHANYAADSIAGGHG